MFALSPRWLGEKYARFALAQLGSSALTTDYGDLDDMHAIQNKLQCKNFDWFMHNVYPDNVLIKVNRTKAKVECSCSVFSNHFLFARHLVFLV